MLDIPLLTGLLNPETLFVAVNLSFACRRSVCFRFHVSLSASISENVPHNSALNSRSAPAIISSLNQPQKSCRLSSGAGQCRRQGRGRVLDPALMVTFPSFLPSSRRTKKQHRTTSGHESCANNLSSGGGRSTKRSSRRARAATASRSASVQLPIIDARAYLTEEKKLGAK